MSSGRNPWAPTFYFFFSFVLFCWIPADHCELRTENVCRDGTKKKKKRKEKRKATAWMRICVWVGVGGGIVARGSSPCRGLARIGDPLAAMICVLVIRCLAMTVSPSFDRRRYPFRVS